VHVCPTGIDIRNGTQLECVNCTACIDACDEVMLKVNRPTGLIRYSSHNAIREGKTRLITPRVMGYGAVLTALLILLGYFIFTRADIEMTILKAPGTLYARADDGQITNLYNIEFVNKTFEDKNLELRVESPQGATLVRLGGEGDLVVPKEGLMKGIFMIKMPETEIKSMKTTVRLSVFSNGEKIETATARFVGPLKR
jgi:polyferredoxin